MFTVPDVPVADVPDASTTAPLAVAASAETRLRIPLLAAAVLLPEDIAMSPPAAAVEDPAVISI